MARDLVATYVDSLGLTEATGAGPAGPVTPAIVLQEAEQLFAGNHFPNRFGELWVRQCWEFHNPVAVGERLDVSATVADVYQRKDRIVVATEHTFHRETRLVARSVHYNSFLLDQVSGPMNLRKATATPLPPDVRRTEEFIGGETRRITTAQCRAFYRGARNYHTDPTAATELGFSGIVIGGGMILPYICEMMELRFGDGWRQAGSLDVKFVNVLHPDQDFVISGGVAGQTVSPTGTVALVDVLCQRFDSTTILAGTASAL